MLLGHQRRSSDHYNELILDSEQWVAALPRTVNAFFAPQTRECQHADCLGKARRARDAFVVAYGLSTEDVPLVWLRLEDTQHPFVLAE